MSDQLSDREMKRLFAIELLRMPGDAFKAACNVFGSDTVRALRASREWPMDREFLEVKAELVDDQGLAPFQPSKEEFARHVLDFANETFTDQTGQVRFAHEGKDRLAAFRLYADVRSFIEKPSIAIDNSVKHVHNVMTVKDHGTDDEWASKLRKSQAALERESSTVN